MREVFPYTLLLCDKHTNRHIKRIDAGNLDRRFSEKMLRFFEKLGLPIFDENYREPGLGSARIGFLANNYIG